MTTASSDRLASANRSHDTRGSGDSTLPECNPSPGPGSWCHGSGKDQQEPELFGLLREHAAGELIPEPVELGKLPEGAWADMHKLAEDMALLMGLRLAVGEDAPLPYSARFAAERMGWADHRRASRAIRRLCDAGVVRYAGSLPPLGKPDGTKTYAPPPLGAEQAPAPRHDLTSLERRPVEVEGVGPTVASEPHPKLPDEAAVGAAVVGEAARRTVAIEDRADGDHGLDATGATGGPDAVTPGGEQVQ